MSKYKGESRKYKIKAKAKTKLESTSEIVEVGKVKSRAQK